MRDFETLNEGVSSILEEARIRGAIAASSNALSREMASQIRDSDRLIVELGSGSGPITKALLEKMSPEATLIAIESESKYREDLELIKDNRLVIIVPGDAQNMTECLDVNQADVIISGLPLNSLPSEKGLAILDEVYRNLKPTGRFSQFQYYPAWYSTISSHFERSTFKMVLNNVPPAVAYHFEHPLQE